MAEFHKIRGLWHTRRFAGQGNAQERFPFKGRIQCQ